MSENFSPEMFCGLEKYGTSSPGIRGDLKKEPEDFVVEEIPIDIEEGGELVLCRLWKRNITTFRALDMVSTSLGVPRRDIGYAGLKDKRACATQFVTLKGIKDEEARMNINGLQVEPVKRVSRPLRAGDLKGNRFSITVRNFDPGVEECRKRLNRLTEEVKEGVPNYYGIQRFGGSRPVTHIVGKKLLLGDFRGAVETYLFRTFPTEREEFRRARRRLDDERDYSDALDYFPGSLRYERELLERITEKPPGDWSRVFKTFPVNLRRLFVHAYQSHVFNRVLSRYIENIDRNFPGKVPGYGTRLSSSEFDSLLREEMERDGVELQDFRFGGMGELSSKGTLRPVLMKPDLAVEKVEDNGATVSFSLKPGRYATVVMREITKNSI